MDDINATLHLPANSPCSPQYRSASVSGYGYGERLFQAARFVTEMEYQHLVFEEFARKVQPAVRPFHVYSPDINPAIDAEFAHAVYRFGHSMLDDTVARTNTIRDRRQDRQLPFAVDGVPQSARVLQRWHGRHADPAEAAGAR